MDAKGVVEKIEEDRTYSVSPRIRPETKSRRVNLVVKPSVYEKAKSKCRDKGMSFNEVVGQLLECWIRDE